MGNEVAALVNEEKPGKYEVQFTVNNVSISGIYFYQIKAGSFSQTRKMILIK
ncbi:MAG: T9SS type A sorting domain-containing protein [Ignavibacteriales bacterium]|nr:T9SS type A sorting domain-containing protein [Ignavibacteriales bacterium]